MKKLFLLALLVAMAGVAQAQQVSVRAPQQTGPGVVSDNSAEGPSVIKEFLGINEAGITARAARKHSTLRKTMVPSTMVEIGKMANTYAVIGENRNQISSDPKTGNVGVIFRGNDRGTSDGNTLYIRYSGDNGQTWGPQGNNISNAPQPRYPIIFINPNQGAGDPAVSVIWPHVKQFGDGTSNFGEINAMKSGVNNANPQYSTAPTPPDWSIPWQIVPDQSTGDLYTIALALDPSNGQSTGELYLLRSTDNGGSWAAHPDLNTPVYTDDLVPQGYFDSNLKIDISPDGTMMQYWLLIIESEPGRAFLLDPGHEIAYRISNDKGRTWGAVQRVKPSSDAVLPSPFDHKCHMAWDLDGVLDYNNVPHFMVVLSADLNPFSFRDEALENGNVKLNHVDSTFVSEVTMIDGQWRVIPIGPSRRPRVDRYSFTAASSTDAPYLFRAEPKWARTLDGKKIFAKWISPILTFRVADVAGQPTAFNDTLTQIYLNGRHVDSKSVFSYKWTWEHGNPEALTWELDSMMRLTELAEVGAKFTKMAYYAGDDGSVHIIFTEWGIGENYDDDPVFSDQTVWYMGGAKLDGIAVGVEQLDAAPGAFALQQNYPNPFNPSTEITFTLPAGAQTTLRVYNMLGQEVSTLVNGFVEAGTHRAAFDAGTLPSGVYMYRLESGSFSTAKRMLLSK
ncbi:MAG TPA: T9SS type A sorting domain-containing protein [Bacteroidota bacterium]|nr:T9SS type A sorting domain-containing protein [Bacteroidota bacterium]